MAGVELSGTADVNHQRPVFQVRHGSPGRYLAGALPDGIDGYSNYQDGDSCPIHFFNFPAVRFGFGSREISKTGIRRDPTHMLIPFCAKTISRSPANFVS